VIGALGLFMSFEVPPTVLECKLFTQCHELNTGYAFVSLFNSTASKTIANEQLALQIGHSIAFTAIFALVGFGIGFALELYRRPAAPIGNFAPQTQAPHPSAHQEGNLELIGLDHLADHYLKIDATELADMPRGLSVGRDPDHVVFPVSHDSVSREHARLRLQSGNFVLEDIGSTNGTRVNGRVLARSETVRLRSGDRVIFGSAAFDVRAS
jgi:hypothetical protein